MTDGFEAATADGASRSLLVTTSLGFGSTFLGLALVSPLLPAISESLGLTPFDTGLALSLLWAVRALAQYPSGRLSDRLSRKTLLVGGLAGAFLGVGLLGLAPTFPIFLLAVVVLGLGNGLYPPAAIALVTDRFADRRGLALGVLIGTADLAGALAGVLAIVVVTSPSWRLGFLPVASAIAISAWLIHRGHREPYVRPRALRLDIAATARRLFGDPDLRWAIAGFALWMVAFQGAVSFLPTYLVAEKGVSLSLAGGGFALLWGVGAAVKPFAGRLGDRVGHLRVATATLATSAVGLAGLLVLEGPALLAVAVIVFAAGLLATTPMVWAYVASASPDADVGGDVGALRTTFEGVGSLGPLGVGLAASSVGYAGGFVGLGVCLVAASLLVGGLAARNARA